MPNPFTRRATLAGFLAATLAPRLAQAASAEAIAGEIAGLERKLGGRIGVAALDLGTKGRVAHRADERFPMCSTFKLLAAGHVLARADRGDEDLERRILFSESDLVAYSPVTRGRVHGQGMSLAELCHAALTQSDNTAGNLLLASFGGPPALTEFAARRLGDEVTRLDRIETELNEAVPGDVRDTTSPAAMLESLRRLLFDEVLTPPSRERLTGWMLESKTGDRRVRSGVPKGWRVGDKTGTGQNGAASDVAVAWPPGGRPPLMIAVYLHGSKAGLPQLDAAIADVGRRCAALG